MTKEYDEVPIRKLPDDESYSSDVEIIAPTIRPRIFSKTKLAKWPHQRGIKPKRKAPEDCLTNDKEYKRKYRKEFEEKNKYQIRERQREYRRKNSEKLKIKARERYLKSKTKQKD